MTEPHAFLPWRTDPERCQVCDRPAAVHARIPLVAVTNATGEQHGAAAGQAQLPAIVAAILIAAGLVLSLHVGVVATTHQLLAWGW